MARFAVESSVGDLFAAEDFAFDETFAEEPGEIGVFAEGFAVAAEAEAVNAEGLFGGGIGAGDDAGGVDDQQAGGHVAGDFFAEALGLFGAVFFDFVEALEFFFLCAEFLNDALHGGGHEGVGIFCAGGEWACLCCWAWRVFSKKTRMK